MQCRKNITVEDNEERMNIANFINMYMYYIYLYIYHIYIYIYKYIYTYVYYVVDNNFGVVFTTFIFEPVSQIVQMEGRYHLLSYKD